MAESYRIIKSPTEGFYKEKGSKFLAFAYQVNSLDEVKEKLEVLKKEYYDARHHCYAHLINDGHQQLIRANDDGEPNHSAGDPILGQIRSFELVNTLVVVVRYFGGTKLGVSGLVHAYKTAAEEALRMAEIEVIEIKQAFKVEYGYEKTSDVMRIVNDFGVEITSQEFLEICTLFGRIEPELFEALKDKLALAEVIVRKL
ncbi:YigZ family protein [Reichenbachiella carrageenanivorans]|uniref:YigZ family protein n=1 Tax=Reichenbachiella carrageenanivorans TaxID=2979869 RepID=A0ABY6D1I3_9BACT|nr:YigZ family protein [Reichenbachiella carrageenanivorans]UXX80026.1 YigZ family protein [Reichenbachiella carrageenanivorans]